MGPSFRMHIQFENSGTFPRRKTKFILNPTLASPSIAAHRQRPRYFPFFLPRDAGSTSFVPFIRTSHLISVAFLRLGNGISDPCSGQTNSNPVSAAKADPRVQEPKLFAKEASSEIMEGAVTTNPV